MFSKYQWFAFLASGILAFGFQYDIEIRNDEIFVACPEYPDSFYDKFVTRPKNVTIMPDDSVYIAGDVLLTYDFQPTTYYKLDLEFFKRERGSWKRTIYTIRRESFCESLYDPNEVWAPVLKNVPAELRKCPFEKGQRFFLDVQTEQGFILPSNSLEGEYRCRIILGNKDVEGEFCCMDFYFTLHRS